MTIRVGVVGTGYLGRLHTRVLSEMPEARLAGFIDVNDEVAREVAAQFKIPRFDSVAALAREVDCAVVGTPTIAHFGVARELLDAGRDVLVEKPITAEAAEGRQLVELAASRGRILQVGHVERYNPAITAVAPLLHDIRYIEAERLGVFVPRSLDVDVLLDLMIHDLNLVQSLLRSPVIEVRAVGVPVLTPKIDITNVRLEMENGAVANLTASRVSQERVRKVRFFSSEAYISVDTKEQEVKGFRLASRAIEPIHVDVERKEPLRAELESFLQCVRERTRPLVDGSDGVAPVSLSPDGAAAIEESLRMWRP